ncbi:ester cyclase [Ferruginibacter paludis]|uniref:ester cyclase n=1 Tax=Ferruginibacter paludis TaxID=1310417 RepID=UPI0025B38709|nr:ester cyclase [Ferruginibacter paludis]MDN3658158.1 ester cyclase [Ferruginibacter paludis]
MKLKYFKSFTIVFVSIIVVGLMQSCNQHSSSNTAGSSNIDSLKKIAQQLVVSNDTIAGHLKTFDALDFDVFSNQQWDRFKESHAQNIKVFWPDGHVTEGLATHIEDMKKLFVHAPDTRIKEHPIKFGSGSYTLVTGVFEGTFTKPMPIGNGKFIQPTGKAFKMPMATVGIWENGVMKEEHLFWDNQTYAKQIGLQ